MTNVTILNSSISETITDLDTLRQYLQKEFKKPLESIAKTLEQSKINLSMTLKDYIESLPNVLPDSKDIKELVYDHDFLDDDIKNMPLDEALSLINDYYENPPLTEFHITQRHLSALSVLLSMPVFDVSDEAKNLIFFILFLLFLSTKE